MVPTFKITPSHYRLESPNAKKPNSLYANTMPKIKITSKTSSLKILFLV
jgi:hypothetical protein